MSKESTWRPWGFDDYVSVPKISDEALSSAMKSLNVTEDAQRADLTARFHEVSVSYWRGKRDFATPGPKWYRQQIQPIQKATNKLLSLLTEPAEGTGRSALVRLTKMRMHRNLRGPTDPDSIEQLLETFKGVCDECLRLKGSAGAREQSHVEEAVRELAAIWRDVTGTPLGLSLDTGIGPSKREFSYPGPFFIQTILQAIDPVLTTAEIGTALRKVLGRGRMQKSKGKCS
jgi:hypothetical protein